MSQLLNSLQRLKDKVEKTNIDIYILADNLCQALIESNIDIEEDNRKPIEQMMFEAYGELFPAMDEEQEAKIGNLRFKFELEHIDHVPTTFIHSKEAIDDETFQNIRSDVQEMVEESASLEMVNPFLLMETHTYCVNLKYHLSLLHGILNKNLYGKYTDENDSSH